MKRKKGGSKMAKSTDLFVIQVDKHREGEPNVVFVLVPEPIANDFEILHRKFENAMINNGEYLRKWGRISLILHVHGLKKVEFFSDDVQPITFADWGNMMVNQLGEHMEDEESNLPSKVEDELVYYLGEFTLLKDGTI
jgi:hypothetical protein